MNAEMPVSDAWRAWLTDQTVAQLETSLGERERNIMNMNDSDPMRGHMRREIEMIRAELLARAEAANATREQFFPRVTLRTMKDAQLIGQLLHAHAKEVIGMSEQVFQYKRLSDAGYPIAVQFMDPMTGQTSNDIEQVLADLAERAIYTAELLGAVSEEMLRLKDVDGVDLSDAENDAFDTIVKLVDEMKGDEKK